MTWRLTVLMLALFVCGRGVAVRRLQPGVRPRLRAAEADNEHRTAIRRSGAILDRTGYP
jgi:hypothetical protein